MTRALSRDEQHVLLHLRQHGGIVLLTELAQELILTEEAVQATCAYLVSRGLLTVSIDAVSATGARKPRVVVPGSPNV